MAGIAGGGPPGGRPRTGRVPAEAAGHEQPYINTVPTSEEPGYPGDLELEERIAAYDRWNAAAMITRGSRLGLGGHLATYASAAWLYEVGFNHFFHGGHDQVYFQGHASPGIYARAFLEGRLTEGQLDLFRREPEGGLPSYPHPRSMREFWQFPTVSMGLGPLNAIYQARFNRYLHNRGIKDTSLSHVWAFLGDGEMDEPESTAAITLAAREGLDNLTFVINCNLQRLDGPVRGNTRIVQELEGVFRGAGWHVVKALWGAEWDGLLDSDELVSRLSEMPDGQFQTFAASTGAYIRQHLFHGLDVPYSDEDLRRIVGGSRAGHEPRKVHAAYRRALDNHGAPTVILVQTVKGWTLGAGVEARNANHQMKKLTQDEFRALRDRLGLPVPDEALDADLPPYLHPGADSPEVRYVTERRRGPGRAHPPPNRLPPAAAGAGRAAVPVPGEGVQAAGGHHDGLRPPGQGPHEGAGDRAPLGAHRARRGQDLRHGVAVPHRQDLLAAGPALRVGRPGPAAVLPGGGRRPAPDRGHHRGGIDGVVHGRRLQLRHPRRGHDPVLHLLLDVRLAADRRPDVGAGRPARPRIPDRRHRGPDHDDRRGAAARRRALPAARLRQPRMPRLRPRLRATRSRTIVREGLRRMYGPDGEDVFYYLTLYNEPLPQPAMPEGVERGHPQGHLPATPPAAARPICSPAAPRSTGRWPRSGCSRRSTAWASTSGRSPRGASCAATR